MKDLIKKVNGWIDPALLLSSVAVLLPLFLIGFYNQPSTDDFDYANLALEKGFWGAQVSNYLSWAGRYFSTALLTTSPLVFHSYLGYKLVCIAMLLGTLLVLHWLLGRVAPDLDPRTRLELTGLFSVIYVLQMPSLSQGFYWMTGAVTYQGANLFTLLFWGGWLGYLKTGRKVLWFLCTFCVIGVVGSNETSMILMVLSLLSAIAFGHWVRRKVRPELWALFVVAVLFSLLVALAPGNGHRGTFFPERHDLLHSLDIVVIGGLKQVLYWIRGHKGLFCFELLAFDLLYRKVAAGWRGGKLVDEGILKGVTLYLLLAPFLGLVPAAWAMGISPPARTANVLYFHFLLGLFCLFILVARRWKSSKKTYDRATLFPRPALLVLGLVLIGTSPNVVTKTYDDLLSGRAGEYQRQMAKRRDRISNSQGETCVLEPIRNRPSVLYFEDITSDMTDWKNSAFSKYCGKKCVLAPSSPVY